MSEVLTTAIPEAQYSGSRAIACQWGPAWLQLALVETTEVQEPQAVTAEPLVSAHAEQAETPASEPAPKLPTGPTDVDLEANEVYWATVDPADYRYLTAPRSILTPCPWCGGRLHHHPFCDDLRAGWVPTMPFGKHKGRKLSDVPRDYLRWLLTLADGISPDLQAAVREQLS